MEWLQQYELFNQREREDFARILNRLLASTFLIKQQEEARRDYYFVERHEAVLAGYLQLIRWELIVDRAYGVVQAVNRQGGTRLPLRLMESVLLLILRLIYEEKRRELTVTDAIVCQVQEIHDKALSLRVRERGVVEKKHLKDALHIFRRYSLAEPIDEEFTDPRCRIKLYPTLLFAVKLDGLQDLHDRLNAYAEGGEPSEVDDGDQAD
jgi:hypothetical protein